MGMRGARHFGRESQRCAMQTHRCVEGTGSAHSTLTSGASLRATQTPPSSSPHGETETQSTSVSQRPPISGPSGASGSAAAAAESPALVVG
jgi:hypothetical protein